MSDLESREKRKMKRKRNQAARALYENKGAFAIKTINPKKTTYKRVKIRPNRLVMEDDDLKHDGN